MGDCVWAGVILTDGMEACVLPASRADVYFCVGKEREGSTSHVRVAGYIGDDLLISSASVSSKSTQ